MTCKLHINLSQGLIEAEGSEEFVLNIYKDFKDKIGTAPHDTRTTGQQKQTPANTIVKPNNRSKSKSTSNKTKVTSKGYTLNKELNLYSEGDNPSLDDFLKDYKTTSNQPRFLLCTHYLKEIKGVEKVGVNELYTCLKHLKIAIPNIEQGLRDTASRKGWLDTASSSSDDIKITVSGENAIAHDLLNSQTEAT